MNQPKDNTLGGGSQTLSGNQGQQQQQQQGQQQQQRQGHGCKFGMEHCKMLNVDDAALILIDHQVGIFNLVRDIDAADLRTNVEALARAAYLADIPVVVTTSKQDSFHGPLIGDLDKIVPNACLIQRDTEINAWENQEFVQTISCLQKKTLIMAGTLTNVCLALAAIAASFAGYRVYAVIDASGGSSKKAAKLAVLRMTCAGIVITDTFAMCAELMQTFDNKEKEHWQHVFGIVVPRYQLLLNSFNKLDIPSSSSSSSTFGRNDERFQTRGQDDRYGRGLDERYKDEDTVGGRRETGSKEYKEVTRLGGNRNKQGWTK